MLVLNVDGGARGNPGPAAIGIVLSSPDGTVLEEIAEPIGVATNNVAEYRAVLRALERARDVGESEIRLIGDSELVARQLTGVYRSPIPPWRSSTPGPRPCWPISRPGPSTPSRGPRTPGRTRWSTGRSMPWTPDGCATDAPHAQGIVLTGRRGANLQYVTEPLIELRSRLQHAARQLRSGETEPEGTLELIEDCVRLAGEASAEVDATARAALEPLPDLPGQLPLPAA